MTEFKIPSSFKLFAETATVSDEPRLLCDHQWAGSANFHKAEIKLVPISDAYPATRVKREQSFFHELTHQVSEAIGLELGEKDTDLFARALHQALTTMEYDS